ncbi:tRNA (adenosine(37)-N6)-threonylcarbamoyltransferase complex ATPase subunit type 1 TsaE [Macromonas nakdongensis]|uniref:tRNA (adenosine(37)-N6)-threonylcarbamoyltransferase complex ATPase subunit type 1 TsaE n=1 Tax=Macromonas nakdongensis TaxID=1843082 RepID=UPI000C3248A1|nr:tRNA (adenosine(37)-N6)-threonylcarbamoyltransferase complex ATPase subunit type 1 TsaE [Macromonas nakdongensis]
MPDATPALATARCPCPTEADTEALARRLASSPALGHALITLHGDLGAGKTTLVRHLLRALGVQGRIKSPTYAVVEPHSAPPAAAWPQGLRIAHFDLYRFSEPREWEDAGLRELFADPGLKLVEWPEKAEGLMPTADLCVTLIPMDDDARTLDLSAHTATGVQLLEAARA